MEERKPYLRIAELVLLFGLLPLFLFAEIFPRPWVLYLAIASVPVLIWLRVARKFHLKDLWSGPEKSSVTPSAIVARFGVMSICLVVLMFVFYPERLLSFPSRDPLRWLAVMFLYPLVMVYPQELVYRVFFSERYGRVLGSGKWVRIINGMLFGWAHILFGNWIAVVLSGIGGALFMDTYLRSRSVRLVWLEHSLYGNLIFTIGLGDFFYSGWAG